MGSVSLLFLFIGPFVFTNSFPFLPLQPRQPRPIKLPRARAPSRQPGFEPATAGTKRRRHATGRERERALAQTSRQAAYHGLIFSAPNCLAIVAVAAAFCRLNQSKLVFAVFPVTVHSATEKIKRTTEKSSTINNQ